MRTRLFKTIKVSAFAGLMGLASLGCGGEESGGVPNAPSNLMATGLTTAVHVTWKDNSSNEHHFALERKTAGGAYQEIVVDPNIIEKHDLVPAGTYIYRIAAVGKDGQKSAYTPEVMATATP